MERLSHFPQKCAEKQVVKKRNNENFDPKTGQPLYHPKIKRGNKNRDLEKSVGEMLYESGKEMLKKKKDVKERQVSKILEEAN